MVRQGLLAGAAVLALTGAAAAQEDSGRQVYEPAFFERFAPQTAFDMIEQIPGFSIRETGGGRGLGQGGTNILINGERVTSKDTDVIEILENTPVQAVKRIEIADAATLGVTGLTGQVANVVLERNEMSGSFRWSPEFQHGAKPLFTRGSVSVTGKRGDLNYTLGLSNGSSRSFEEGPEVVIFGDGRPDEDRFERTRVATELPSITAALEFPVGERTTLNLRSSAGTLSLEQEETSLGFDGGVRISKLSADQWFANVAAELTRRVGDDASLKVIASQNYTEAPLVNDINALARPNAADLTARFVNDDKSGESILRTEYAWKTNKKVSWELAGEVAYNFLDNTSSLVINNGTPTLTPPTYVDEIRAQSSITRGFTLGKKLAVQASLGSEWSQIEADSEGNVRSDEFFRPKGLLTVAYPFTDDLDFRARIERSVGQLDFSDFVDSTDLTEERIQGGNVNLVPQQAWEGEVELERRFSDKEKIIFRLEGALIEDRVDRIVILTDVNGTLQLTDAVGNIDEASSAKATVEGTVFTKRWGLDGGRIDFRGTRETSRLEDPLTGEDRNFSLVQQWTYFVNFRHDIPGTPYAWGTGVVNAAPRTVYRFNEVSRAETPQPNLSLFVEHKDFYGLNLNIRAGNLLNQEDVRDRTIFVDRRDTSALNRIESRERIDNQVFRITLSGTF
ncbi:TonB-dependent receptor [Parvularcula lutaonensis]|nr:TonB-dependent receptor [Parvularcula lutaonensis]